MTTEPTCPGFLGRVEGFVISFKDWFESGMPWRHPDDTRELFETHCLGGDGEPCEFYHAERRAFIGWPAGTCGHCGCHVSPDPVSMLNKVNKPHMGCSAGKWMPIIDIDRPT